MTHSSFYKADTLGKYSDTSHSSTCSYCFFQWNNVATVYRAHTFQQRLWLTELHKAQCISTILQSCNTCLIPIYLAERGDRVTKLGFGLLFVLLIKTYNYQKKYIS